MIGRGSEGQTQPQEDSVGRIKNGLPAGQSGVPNTAQAKRPHTPWGPPSPLFSAYRCPFSGNEGPCVKFTSLQLARG
jgi:hypothetical protein